MLFLKIKMSLCGLVFLGHANKESVLIGNILKQLFIPFFVPILNGNTYL